MTLRGVIVSFIMTIVLSIMVLGYAALQQRIDIEAEANIDSTYRVEITKVQEGTVTGNARSTNAPQYNGLNASFYAGLTNTTDTITYNIEITNYSTVDIKLNELEINKTNNNIKASKSGIRNGDIMLAGSTKTITLKVKYNGEQQQEEEIGTVTLNFNFTRLKGGTGEVVADNSYSIGDKVTFKESDWYVIEESDSDQDYVVLLKDDALTFDEVLEYGGGHINRYTQDPVGVPVNKNGYGGVAYYSSESCGYIDNKLIYSGCKTDYNESDIKYIIDNWSESMFNKGELKNINNLKARLLTYDEAILTGCSTTNNSCPVWVELNSYYWTMTTSNSKYYQMYIINYPSKIATTGGYGIGSVARASAGLVRPVINLYKSAIVSE